MEFNELKTFCDEKIKSFPEYQNRYDKEIIKAEISYENGINLFSELNNNKDKVSKRYVIPFLLGITKEVDLKLPLELKQAKSGDGGKE